MDPLFPELPEDLSSLSDEELDESLKEHRIAAQLIKDEDEEFTKGLSADDVLSQLDAGVEQIERIVAEQKARKDREVEYLAEKDEKFNRLAAALGDEVAEDGDDAGDEGTGDEAEESEEGEAAEELAAEAEVEETEETEAEPLADESSEEKTTAVVASGTQERRPLRRPPSPSAERKAPTGGSALIAAAGTPSLRGGQVLDRMGLAEAVKKLAVSIGAPTKHEGGIEQRFLIASAEYQFPPDRVLGPDDPAENARKIRAAIPHGLPGFGGNRALVASGGLCAPLENVYSLVNFASQARPVRDALPSFQATRGGVNVPESSYIGDIDVSETNEAGSAVGIITEEEDALGGTFATKSCMDLECPSYVETAVTIIYHCREYGNLNARAWPEKIAHENDLTMAAHARSAEMYLLRRIRALSLAATQATIGGDLNAFGSLVHAITKAAASIRFNLRMNPDFRFRVLMPQWIGDLLAADRAFMQFKPAEAQAALTAELARYGVSISYYMDDPGGAVSQGFPTQTGGAALDDFPASVQYALFPEGAFVHLDGGSLELGLVRDSSLNSTNDFQMFGENFENVFRLAPLQATRWITQVICPTGVYPDLGTALAC